MHDIEYKRQETSGWHGRHEVHSMRSFFSIWEWMSKGGATSVAGDPKMHISYYSDIVKCMERTLEDLGNI